MKSRKTTAPKPSDELKTAVRAYLAARATAETLKPIVNQIQADLLAEQKPQYAETWAGPRGLRLSGTITNIEDAYLMSDADAALYYTELDRRIHARFPNTPPECCPYLIAQGHQIDAERMIINLGFAMLNASHPRADAVIGEDRAKMIDLMLRFVVPQL